MNKRTELEALIDLHKPNIVGLVEVKPKRSRYRVQECEIAIPGYETFHNLEDGGRGICLYIKTDMKPNKLDVKTEGEEFAFATCSTGNKETMIIGLVYRSPNSTVINNEQICRALLEVADKKPDHLVIFGDFNFPHVNWQEEYNLTSSCSAPAKQFYKATKDAFLIQHQRHKTRIRKGQKPTCDDLFFTNRDDILKEITITGALGKSDHATLIARLDISLPITKPAQEKFNFHKADYSGMKTFLGGKNWKEEMSGMNVNQAWEFFTKTLDEAKLNFVPKTKAGGIKKKKWLDGGTLNCVRAKHKLYRKWLKTGNTNDYNEYARARNKAAKTCRKAKMKLEATIAEQAKSNPKSFWSYVKAKTSTRTGIADLKLQNGSTAKTDKEKADALNDFFSSVFTEEPEGDMPPPLEFEIPFDLEQIDITEESVEKIMLNLKTDKASGPDGIPPLVLSETATEITPAITMIFRKSLEEGSIPNDWRRANVTPIFKKGSRALTNNYRPVSLTSVLCKCMETLIKRKIMEHLQLNRLICKQQHGFVPGRSCNSQLLDTLDCWTEILDQGGDDRCCLHGLS